MDNRYAPETEELEWISDAACADLPVEAFFVEAGRVISNETLDVCRRCPVRRQCLEYAYERDFTAGYFGGLSPGQRQNWSLAKALQFIKRDRSRKRTKS